nr:MAG TPA: hypothetical protein [Caudoviricetes sp.]
MSKSNKAELNSATLSITATRRIAQLNFSCYKSRHVEI